MAKEYVDGTQVLKGVSRRSPKLGTAIAVLAAVAALLGWVVTFGNNIVTISNWLGFERAPIVIDSKKQWRVYFDFDKTGLTPEAKQVVDGIGQDLHEYPDYDAVVQGYTDNSGGNVDDDGNPLPPRSPASLQVDALGRAETVKNALVQNGIPENRISISPPVVALTDRDPFARVVVINLGPPK
jgi:hypothetical protein